MSKVFIPKNTELYGEANQKHGNIGNTLPTRPAINLTQQEKVIETNEQIRGNIVNLLGDIRQEGNQAEEPYPKNQTRLILLSLG